MDKKSRNTIIISIVALALVLITVTYAYFSARIIGIESASTINLTAGYMGIIYTEGSENVVLDNIYPREEAWVTKTFTLTGDNTTSMDMKYDMGLDVTTNTYPNNYITYDLRMVSSTNGTPIATQNNQPINGTGFKKFGSGTFTNANRDTHNYELKIYFKDNGENQNDAQDAVFNAKITVAEYAEPAPDGWKTAAPGTLLAGIKANNTLRNTLTTPGEEHYQTGLGATDILGDYTNYYWTYGTGYVDNGNGTYNLTGVSTMTLSSSTNRTNLAGKYIVNTNPALASSSTDTTLNYNNLSHLIYVNQVGTHLGINYYIKYTDMSVTPEAVLASTEDDYGTSYYFRGEVENNYIIFANMCWRIVRITGNGAIKLTMFNYNSDNVQNPCNTDEGRYSSKSMPINSAYNSSATNNAAIGFMYSNNPDSSDFDTAQANDIDSTILTNLKSWYDTNLRTYNNQLADVIWCNDKSVVTDTTYDPFSAGTVVGTGVGSSLTYYSPTYRMIPTNSASPSLVCPNVGSDGKLSKFTARDTEYGNAKLYSDNKEYKIGLLTTDEVIYAGTVYSSQLTFYDIDFYLKGNALSSQYWLLSPRSTSNVWYMSGGSLYSGGVTRPDYRARPAIALKPDTTISGGNGTASNPFIVN